jgi:DNA-binding NtrC family response regulator
MNLHAEVSPNERVVAHEDHGGVRVPIGSSLEQAERWLIEATLAHWAGNKNRAAKMLGCSLKTLYNKLAAYERQSLEAHA